MIEVIEKVLEDNGFEFVAMDEVCSEHGFGMVTRRIYRKASSDEEICITEGVKGDFGA